MLRPINNKRKKVILILFFLVVITALSKQGVEMVLNNKVEKKENLIIIDPGHGGSQLRK